MYGVRQNPFLLVPAWAWIVYGRCHERSKSANNQAHQFQGAVTGLGISVVKELLASSLQVWLTLSIKIAQKPYMIWSLGPKALKYESFEGKGYAS